MPQIIQIDFSAITAFIHNRFKKYELIKREHPQWALDGHLLWRLFQDYRDDDKSFDHALVPVAEPLRIEQIDKYCEDNSYHH